MCVSEAGGRGGGSEKGTHEHWICNASWFIAFLTCVVVSDRGGRESGSYAQTLHLQCQRFNTFLMCVVVLDAGGRGYAKEVMQILQSNAECRLSAAVVCLHFRGQMRRTCEYATNLGIMLSAG